VIAITNLDDKRVCDLSADGRAVFIQKKDCLTSIYINDLGTLSIAHEPLAA